MISHHAAIARTFAGQLGLPDGRGRGDRGASYEHWDGHGWPGELRGDAVPIASRLALLSEFAEVAYRVGGVRRRGQPWPTSGAAGSSIPCVSQDPLRGGAQPILAGLDADRALGCGDRRRAGAHGRALGRTGSTSRSQAIANFVDLKSPVQPRACARRRRSGCRGGDRARTGPGGGAHPLARRARARSRPARRLERDLGQAAGRWGAGEWERVRIHPYLTERMLAQSPALAPLGAIAVAHRERLDGSGYPRGLAGAAISPLGPDPRPPPTPTRRCASRARHRPERSAAEAAAELHGDVRAGRLDAEAVEAVLGAAGHRVPRRREGPAGLTAREIDVLQAGWPAACPTGRSPGGW